MDKNIKSRKKKKYICPNPLFEKWLTEWKESASSKGLKSHHTFSKALASLRKYPLPLSSGKEAKILENFGDKICAMLDAKLLEWKQENNFVTQSESQDVMTRISNTKSELISLPNNSPVKMKTKKNVVKDNKILLPKITKTSPVIKQMPTSEILEDDITLFQEFYLLPGNYDIVLCIDNAETSTGNYKYKKQLLSELQKCNISYDVRKLNVGDFVWIAREKLNQQREIVLDFIVERKRMDDLGSSIKDGRFREQKFRLKNSGLKQPIYLVEYHSDYKYCGIPEATLEQAIVNTQIIDGFLIKRTQNIKESALYLSSMTKQLQEKYLAKTLKSVPRRFISRDEKSCTFMDFKEFNSSTIKNKKLTIQEMFAKHLLQFFGLSVERASAIVEHFPTPIKLFKAYDDCLTEEEKLLMISSLRFGKFQKVIGPALSKNFYQVYCVNGPLY